MAISSQGATFTFPGITAHYTSISVEEPEAEVVDMTAISDPLTVKRRMMETGDFTSPGGVRVDYVRLSGSPAPLSISGTTGQLSISHSALAVTKRAILQSATSEMAVGEFLRGSMTFVIDHGT